LFKHGKHKFVDFTGEELSKLREYFRELDEDGSGKFYFILINSSIIGSIGIEELEKPLISLGLCQNRT
jgi:hydroxymethylpyrimidine pyrophosphatase-like HAD family hydrolase